MSNVVTLRRVQLPTAESVFPDLVDLFVRRRRQRHDPFWLKENAELVQILAANRISNLDLSVFEPIVSGLMAELRFFPQYYRLYLSLAVDLSALGMPNLPLEEMASFVQDEELTEVELSDPHRAESRLLLRRAGAHVAADPDLDQRLMQFAGQSRNFCLPNRRAAYDLTHVVFHASDYGRKVLLKDAAMEQSLIFAGMIAWLEDNLDLLSEVVIALCLLGATPPERWVKAIRKDVGQVTFSSGFEGARFDDDYHQYLVSNWAVTVLGDRGFADFVPPSARLIHQDRPKGQALRDLSMILLEMGDSRSADWSHMRWRIWGRLPETSRQRLAAIEDMPGFDRFFEGFARAGEGKCGARS